MPPDRYTALFFFDEATALAAGHRPCGECRRDDLARYRAALDKDESTRLSLAEIDRQLHAERTDRRTRLTRPHMADITTLPDGAMILTPEGPTHCALVVRDALRPWSAAGYGAPLLRPTHNVVPVLPPLMTCRALANGYRAAWLCG